MSWLMLTGAIVTEVIAGTVAPEPRRRHSLTRHHVRAAVPSGRLVP
ncbi:MAG: hypothetical protein ACRDN9_03850 [Streptosporangiaceae bacterium]